MVDLTKVCGETFVDWDTIEGVVLSFSGTFDLRGKSGPSKIISSSTSDPDPRYIVLVTGME